MTTNAPTRTLCCAPDLCPVCYDHGGHVSNVPADAPTVGAAYQVMRGARLLIVDAVVEHVFADPSSTSGFGVKVRGLRPVNPPQPISTYLTGDDTTFVPC